MSFYSVVEIDKRQKIMKFLYEIFKKTLYPMTFGNALYFHESFTRKIQITKLKKRIIQNEPSVWKFRKRLEEMPKAFLLMETQETTSLTKWISVSRLLQIPLTWPAYA